MTESLRKRTESEDKALLNRTNQSITSSFHDNIFDKDAHGFTRSRVQRPTQNRHVTVTRLIIWTKRLDHCSITLDGEMAL